MFTRLSRALLVAVLACGWAVAQEPAKKPEAKPEVKPEAKKTETPAPQEKKDAAKDVIAVAQDLKLNTLVDLIKAAGLVDTLKGPGPFTIFAPTDEAFAKLGPLDDLKKDKAKLEGILKAHVVKGNMKKDDVAKAKDPLKSLNGDIVVKDGKVAGFNVVKADNMASNGVIHTIDGVIMPAPAAKPADAKPATPPPAAKPADKPATPPAAKPADKKPDAKPADKPADQPKH